MPDFAYVKGNGYCPTCNTHLLNGLRVQWGGLPSPAYSIGDSVSWLLDRAGRIRPSFQLFKNIQGNHQWNCGDPQFKNVILLDGDIYGEMMKYNEKEIACPKCGLVIAAGSVTVRDGRFAEIRALSVSQLESMGFRRHTDFYIAVVRPDESLWIRDDWGDIPIPLGKEDEDEAK
jgi:hypothetical protein